MITSGFLAIFLNALFLKNFVLIMFLGLCAFFGVSRETKPALAMGATVTAVMTCATPLTWVLYHQVLEPLGLTYLWIMIFILIIATFVEMAAHIIRQTNPPLYRTMGIYLPLVATNCAILGAALLNIAWGYTLAESFVFGLGGGLGFAMVMLIMSGIRERLELAAVPLAFKGAPLAFIIGGLLSMIFIRYFGVFNL